MEAENKRANMVSRWPDLGTGSSLAEMLDTAVSKVMQKMRVPKNAQMAEIQRANLNKESDADIQRANMEAEIQRVRGEAQREREEDRKEQQRVREEEQKRYREAEDERNRKERERVAEQQTYERGLLKERDRQMEADTMFMRQQVVNQTSVIGATLGATLGASYYHYSANYPALASLAPVPAPAPLQPLLAHAPLDSALLLTDRTNVPGPEEPATLLPGVLTWLLHQRIVATAAEVDLTKLCKFGVVDGADILSLTAEELGEVGFKTLAVRKLISLINNPTSIKP